MNRIGLILLCLILAACTTPGPQIGIMTSTNVDAKTLSPAVNITNSVKKPPTTTVSPSTILQPTFTSSPIPTQSPTVSPTISPSQTPTQFYTPTFTPTYAILRGTVLEQSNCRYGPGAAYLYKYGLFEGNNLEIIGRNETGTWIVMRAIGGTNPCWIKASLMDIHGDTLALAPASLPLPQSPYYGPLTGVSAMRNGDSVIISWNPLYLRAGDDSLQYPYLIEAWLCHDGQLIFEPIGSWETIMTVTDESGCSEPSHARVYGVEKHGYTAWVNVPWTQP